MYAADQSVEVESLTALSDDFVTSGPEIHRAGSPIQSLSALSRHFCFHNYFCGALLRSFVSYERCKMSTFQNHALDHCIAAPEHKRMQIALDPNKMDVPLHRSPRRFAQIQMRRSAEGRRDHQNA